MSSNVDVKSSEWKLVEVGRVVILRNGPYSDRLAAIVEIIDHKRILVDGPSKNSHVPRHSISLANVLLTPIVIPELPRGIRSGPLLKKWEKEDVNKKWAESAHAKAQAQKAKRQQLTDFERFKVMILKKQARAEVRKAHAAIRRSTK